MIPYGVILSWSALVQVLAYILFGAKPLSESFLTHCQLNPYEQISLKLSQNKKLLIQENSLENIFVQTLKVSILVVVLCMGQRGRMVIPSVEAWVFT